MFAIIDTTRFLVYVQVYEWRRKDVGRLPELGRQMKRTVTAENTVYFIIMREFQIDNLRTE